MKALHNYKYQLIILGSIKPEIRSNLENKFYERLEELCLKKEFYDIYDINSFKRYEGNQPAYVFYFGDEQSEFKDVTEVKKLLIEGNIVLPIFFKDFDKEIPKVLSNQNGIKYSESNENKIVNLALESFGVLRNTRKVFISYKRTESTSVAIQLYEALEKYNFDVFLDTHSIKQGEPFQDELWHRMTDCDVVILLNTPEFLTSKWCEEEIAEASAKQIGVIQVTWPNHQLEKMAQLSFQFELNKDNFIDGNYQNKDTAKLTDETVNWLLDQVESVRARNLAARQNNLITNFVSLAKGHNKEINLQPERYLTEDFAGNTKRIFIPLIGIPQSIDCNNSSNLKQKIKEYDISDIYLLYDDLRIRDKWLKHLDYLNDHLDVKTIKSKDFDQWLENN